MNWPVHFESLIGSPCYTKALFLRLGPKTRSAIAGIPASDSFSIECLVLPLIFNQWRNTWNAMSRATRQSYENGSKSGSFRAGVSHHSDIYSHLFDDDQLAYRERTLQDLPSLCGRTRSRRACAVRRY